MRSLQDAVYNWLTIKVVCDARPDDTAAADTLNLFQQLLQDEHHVASIKVNREEPFYFVDIQTKQEEHKKLRFPIELIDVMLEQMIAEPEKYKNYND
ncbi:hypothetical protein [Peribacillus sp. SCS-155]|uniref:hypothetical protein n=1 Tax=Peribacillus sedimenti TaxID=3115297 RepID=UPI0039069239